MPNLRSLNFSRPLFLLLFIFFENVANAAPAQVDTQFAIGSSSGSALPSLTSSSPSVSSQSSTINFRSRSFARNSLVSTVSVSNAQRDYSSTIITSATGEQAPLRAYKIMETSAETGLEWKSGVHTTNIAYAQMLSESPYHFQAASAAYNRTFYSNSSALGAEFAWSEQKQPLNYYVDPSQAYQNRARPTQVQLQRLQFWYEQILSSQWKTQARALIGRRSDRPQHLGAEWRNSVSLSDRIFARLDVGALTEDRTQALADERGYFDIYWVEGQATYELFYDFLLTGSAGFLVEREDVPWDRDARGISRKDQFGADTYGLKLSYKGQQWSTGISGQFTTSNTTYRASTISGSVTWEL